MLTAGHVLGGIDRCPQCGVADPNLVYRTFVPFPHNQNQMNFGWFIYQCATCHDTVMVRVLYDALKMKDNFRETYLDSSPPLFAYTVPEGRMIDADIPERARTYLKQAINSRSAPDGAVMLAGSAVDAMLKAAGYTEGSVYTRIEAAVRDHVLTPAMQEWAHAVRLEANKPRHADLSEPHANSEMADQTIGFAEALGEYLFSLPSRVARGKDAALNE